MPFAAARDSSDLLATMTLVVAACGNAGGRILSGWFSDSLGPPERAGLMIGISVVAMPLLYKAGATVSLL